MHSESIEPTPNLSSKFLISDAIKLAWEKTKGAKGTIWLATLINVLINLGLSLIDYLTNETLIFGIISYIITNLLMLGIILIGTRRAVDLPIHYSMLFQTFKLRFGIRLILTMLLFTVLICIPIIVAIILQILTPLLGKILTAALTALMGCFVIFLLIRLSLTFRIAVMHNINAWQANKLSFIATRHHFWRLLGLEIVNILILTVSLIPLGIGLIWTIPYYTISWGVVYRYLFKRNNASNTFS